MEKRVKGFTENNLEEKTGIYDVHNTKLVRITKNGEGAYGCFRGIEGCTIMLQPSITLGPDDRYVIEHERPTQISPSYDILIRPIPGTLEDWVDKFNRDDSESQKDSEKKE